MSKKITREKILARLNGEAFQIQGRIEKISEKTERLPNFRRKILILKEDQSRLTRSIRKEFKALRRELDSYIDFVEEDISPKDEKSKQKKEELLKLLGDLKSSLEDHEKNFSDLQEDFPPDII